MDPDAGGRRIGTIAARQAGSLHPCGRDGQPYSIFNDTAAMFTFIIVLIALIAVLITLVVLVQSGRGGGLAGIAAGGATQQILGTRQAPDVLEKATWMLVTLFIVLCVVSNFTIREEQAQESVIQQRAQEEQTTPALPPAGEQQELPSLPEPAPAEE